MNMPKKVQDPQKRVVELLEKILVFQMYNLGASQDRIAETLGRGKAWVVDLEKEIPKGGTNNGGKAKVKK
jgi:hypothetical protein